MNTDLKSDFESVRRDVGPLWDKLRGKRVFVTGGTGFFGAWLLETLIHADRELKLGTEVVVLTRDPEAFEKRAPHLAKAKGVQLHPGDVRNFARPPGQFTHVIHAATEVARISHTSSLTTLDSIVSGTRHVLDTFAPNSPNSQNALESFLYVSSGAVYGVQPTSIDKITEDSPHAPLTADLASTYGQAKRIAEHLCLLYGQKSLSVKIARCFAFIGPYMPFDSHLAAGNFIQSALDQKDIQITGDGTTLRSYLYASDLATWLWTILLAGQSGGIYNVGSEQSVSIGELATRTQSALNASGQVHLAKSAAPGVLPARYVPSVERARAELGLSTTVNLEEAIRRTGQWRKQQLSLPIETSPLS